PSNLHKLHSVHFCTGQVDGISSGKKINLETKNTYHSFQRNWESYLAHVLGWTFVVRPLEVKWSGSTPRRFNFQLIHLGGSFMVTPCKPHYRSLHCPRASAHTPPPAFAKEPHCPSHTGLHFVIFVFVREPLSPSPRLHFSFMTQRSKWITNEDENSYFSTALRRFSSDFRIDDVFWSGASCVERSLNE
ncbi:hypothetical protein AVEN_242372-1, partial [Araneus ventricosus]